MNNHEAIQRFTVSGRAPFARVTLEDMAWILDRVATFTACKGCFLAWTQDCYSCKSRIEAWLMQEVKTDWCADCPAKEYCGELDTEYPNCAVVIKEWLERVAGE